MLSINRLVLQLVLIQNSADTSKLTKHRPLIIQHNFLVQGLDALSVANSKSHARRKPTYIRK